MLSWNSCLVKAWEYRLGVNIRKQIAEMKKFNEKGERNVFKFIIILISKKRLKHQTKLVQ
jgi:hypothetical protein